MSLGAAPTVECLTSCGLPEVQAKQSVEALTKERVIKDPCSMHYVLTIKEGSTLADFQESLDEYGSRAKLIPGKVASQYAVTDKEVLFFEVSDSTETMDIHIGYCFPSYVKMMAHCDMKFIRLTCDPGQTEWWEKSCSAWGGELVVAPNRTAGSN